MSVFDKAAKVVGDLDHPFYAEERQREVWNEASAVGFQVILWGSLVLACTMVWVGGGPLVPWAVALLIVAGLGGWATILYANRQGVTGTEGGVEWLRPRTLLVGALVIATFAGIAIRGEGSPDPSTLVGAAVGAVAAVVAVAMSVRRQRRRESQET